MAVIEVLYQKHDIEKQIDQQFKEDEQSEAEYNFSESNSCKGEGFSDN